MDSSPIIHSPQHQDYAFLSLWCSRSAAACCGALSWPQGTSIPALWMVEQVANPQLCCHHCCMVLGPCLGWFSWWDGDRDGVGMGWG